MHGFRIWEPKGAKREIHTSCRIALLVPLVKPQSQAAAGREIQDGRSALSSAAYTTSAALSSAASTVARTHRHAASVIEDAEA